MLKQVNSHSKKSTKQNKSEAVLLVNQNLIPNFSKYYNEKIKTNSGKNLIDRIIQHRVFSSVCKKINNQPKYNPNFSTKHYKNISVGNFSNNIIRKESGKYNNKQLQKNNNLEYDQHPKKIFFKSFYNQISEDEFKGKFQKYIINVENPKPISNINDENLKMVVYTTLKK